MNVLGIIVAIMKHGLFALMACLCDMITIDSIFVVDDYLFSLITSLGDDLLPISTLCMYRF